MFVLKANRSSTNMAKVRQWLILLARALAIFALIIAISRPLLGGWLGWKFSGEPDTVLILLDRSATMSSSFSNDQSRLNKALELIIDAGEKTASTSRIVLIDSALLGLYEIPSWQVLKEIKETQETQTSADILAMYRIALDYMANNVTGVTEVWTLSDMQKSNWDTESSEWQEVDGGFASLPQPVTFRTLAVESENKANSSISLSKLAEFPGKDGKMVREISFEINSPSGVIEGTEIPLQLTENGTQLQLTVKISGRSTEIRHTLSDIEDDKPVYGSITLPPDSNPSDNSLFFGFAPKSPEKALVIYDNEKAANLLSAAAAPEGELLGQSAEMITASEFANYNIESASVVICQVDPDKKMIKNLNEFAQKGGNVIFFPPSSAVSSNDSIWAKIQTFDEENEIIVAEWNKNDGPLANTVSGDELTVDAIKLKKRILLRKFKSIPIASCSDGKPFLYGEKKGKGMLYYCTTLPVVDWSNLGDGPVIVPMLRRLMQDGSQRLSNVIFEECGKWQPASGDIGNIMLISKQSESQESNPLCNSGIYSLDDKIIILNRPAVEDIYNPIDKSELQNLFANNPIRLFKETGDSVSTMQSEVWRLFIFAVLCAMSLEAFLCLPLKVKNK